MWRTRIFTKAVLRRKARVFGVALVLLTALGPFGTFKEFNVFARTAYWATNLFFCSLIFEITVPGLLFNVKLSRKLSRWPRFLLGVGLGSFLGGWVVFLIKFITYEPFSLTILPYLFVYVGMIGLPIAYISFMLHFTHTKAAGSIPEIDFEWVAFFDNYPALKGTRIRWITMEDHYARMVLENEEISLYASMRELEQQLSNYPGLRVHRSHWVAYDQVKAIERDGRKYVIKLDDETRLPLGSKYRQQVEKIVAELAIVDSPAPA